MKSQNFENHKRFVIPYHFVTFFLILLFILGAIRNLVVTSDENLYPAVLLVLLGIIVLFMFFFLRVFALKAQDRAIKVEVNLRFYVLTGKLLDSKLNMRQIVALRFASDEELVSLVKKAIEENLSENDIKKSIKVWQPDNYRV